MGERCNRASAARLARESDTETTFGWFLKIRLLSRLLPFVFFSAIFMVLPALFAGELFFLKLPTLEGYLTGLTPTAKKGGDNLPTSFFSVLQVGCFMTIVSLALCIPMLNLFDRYLPQLVGKPKMHGPLLKNLL